MLSGLVGATALLLPGSVAQPRLTCFATVRRRCLYRAQLRAAQQAPQLPRPNVIPACAAQGNTAAQGFNGEWHRMQPRLRRCESQRQAVAYP